MQCGIVTVIYQWHGADSWPRMEVFDDLGPSLEKKDHTCPIQRPSARGNHTTLQTVHAMSMAYVQSMTPCRHVFFPKMAGGRFLGHAQIRFRWRQTSLILIFCGYWCQARATVLLAAAGGLDIPAAGNFRVVAV